VRVDHGRADVLVAQELLDRADVVTALQQVRRERMAQGVGARHFGDPSSANRRAHGALDDSFVQMVTAALAGLAIDVGAGGGEDPLPGPLTRGGRVLARNGVRKRDEAAAATPVIGVLGAPCRQLAAQRFSQYPRQDRAPIFLPFSPSHDQLSVFEVDVLHPKLQGLEQPHAGAVEHRPDRRAPRAPRRG